MFIALVHAALAQPVVEARVVRPNGRVVAAARYVEDDWREGVPWVFSVRGEAYALVADGDVFCMYASVPGVQGVPGVAMSCVSGPHTEIAMPASDRLAWELVPVDIEDPVSR